MKTTKPQKPLHQSSGISISDWLDDVKSVSKKSEETPPGTFTVQQLSKTSGLSTRTIRDMLSSGYFVFAGAIKKPRNDGVLARVPFYRLAKGAQAAIEARKRLNPAFLTAWASRVSRKA